MFRKGHRGPPAVSLFYPILLCLLLGSPKIFVGQQHGGAYGISHGSSAVLRPCPARPCHFTTSHRIANVGAQWEYESDNIIQRFSTLSGVKPQTPLNVKVQTLLNVSSSNATASNKRSTTCLRPTRHYPASLPVCLRRLFPACHFLLSISARRFGFVFLC